MDNITPEIAAIALPDWCYWKVFFGEPAIAVRNDSPQNKKYRGAFFAWVNSNNSVYVNPFGKGVTDPFFSKEEACQYMATVAWTIE